MQCVGVRGRKLHRESPKNAGLFFVCSCSKRSVGLHRAEPDGGFGSHLVGFLSGVWPLERHPRSTRGASESSSFHPNECRAGSAFGLCGGGLASPHRGWRSGNLEGLKLHLALLSLLETATILPTGPAGWEKIRTFASDKSRRYMSNMSKKKKLWRSFCCHLTIWPVICDVSESE